MKGTMRLTVELADGRVLSGVYDTVGALARLEAARAWKDFVNFKLEEAR